MLSAFIVSASPPAVGATQAAQSRGQLRRMGTTDLRQVADAPHAAVPAMPDFHEVGGVEVPKSGVDNRSGPIPDPVPRPVTTGVPAGVAGFDGISHRDHRLADNGNQRSGEPPDRACASATATSWSR